MSVEARDNYLPLFFTLALGGEGVLGLQEVTFGPAPLPTPRPPPPMVHRRDTQSPRPSSATRYRRKCATALSRHCIGMTEGHNTTVLEGSQSQAADFATVACWIPHGGGVSLPGNALKRACMARGVFSAAGFDRKGIHHPVVGHT